MTVNLGGGGGCHTHGLVGQTADARAMSAPLAAMGQLVGISVARQQRAFGRAGAAIRQEPPLGRREIGYDGRAHVEGDLVEIIWTTWDPQSLDYRTKALQRIT